MGLMLREEDVLDSNMGESIEELTEVLVRPVGMWRFLSRLETVKEGDLIRVIAVSDAEDAVIWEHNWSYVDEDQIGEKMVDNPLWEVLRPIDGSATTVPLFEGISAEPT